MGEYPNKGNGEGENGSRLNEGLRRYENRQNVVLRSSKGVRGGWRLAGGGPKWERRENGQRI